MGKQKKGKGTKKKDKCLPKVRGTWKINPKTQVVPNKKKDLGTRKEKNPRKDYYDD